MNGIAALTSFSVHLSKKAADFWMLILYPAVLLDMLNYLLYSGALPIVTLTVIVVSFLPEISTNTLSFEIGSCYIA